MKVCEDVSAEEHPVGGGRERERLLYVVLLTVYCAKHITIDLCNVVLISLCYWYIEIDTPILYI